MPIKYLGSKRVFLPEIVRTVQALVPAGGTVVDLFSGTARVGHALKRAGYRVLSNDNTAFAAAIARCYVQADRERWEEPARKLIEELQTLPGRPGYFTQTFCVRSRYCQPHNGERIDAIREEIARKALDPELEAILLVSLMEAADRVDSTAGVQMAYLKNWSERSRRDLELRLPELLPRPEAGACEAHRLDAIEAAARLEGDLHYLDPPYNQHSYLGNYHVWESLVAWDKPEVYGVACKRIDCKERRSPFNRRLAFREAWSQMLERAAAPRLLVSFSNEGFLRREEVEDLLGEHGRVEVNEREHRRYIGARIGIHDHKGRVVGEVGHLRNKEFLFTVERGQKRAAEAG